MQTRQQAQRVGALALGARLVELGEDGRPVEACTVEVRVRVRVRARARAKGECEGEGEGSESGLTGHLGVDRLYDGVEVPRGERLDRVLLVRVELGVELEVAARDRAREGAWSGLGSGLG